jgi:iduronate 2-sulfatase
MAPLLRDPQGAWEGPSVATSTYATKAGVLARYGPEIGESQFTVRGDRWRYTRYGDGSEELFDHETDPNEWDNRAGDATLAEEQTAMKALFDRLTPWRVPEASGLGT